MGGESVKDFNLAAVVENVLSSLVGYGGTLMSCSEFLEQDEWFLKKCLKSELNY